jgi:hypothetical protein
VSVKGGATKTCTVTATANARQIDTPNKWSPQRCVVSLAATGPMNPKTAQLDPSSNSTELMIDIVDKNDL